MIKRTIALVVAICALTLGSLTVGTLGATDPASARAATTTTSATSTTTPSYGPPSAICRIIPWLCR